MKGLISSKINSKARTTIPKAVRQALCLRPGDEIAYTIEDGHVIMSKADASPAMDDRFATFEEWDSNADRKVYADL